MMEDAPAVMGSPSHRGVVDDYQILPSDAELTAQMRFVMADGGTLSTDKLKFSDLALFDASGRVSVSKHLELSAQVALLPKQPSFTDEKAWQSAGGGLRLEVDPHVALAVSGGGGHLIDHVGMWTQAAAALEWRKRVHEILSFDLSGGADRIGISAPDSTSANLTEIQFSTGATIRDPHGAVGAWAGIAYAVPVAKHGIDPTSGLSIDPQPRLDFKVGAVLSIVEEWDLFVEYAVIDRGDVSNPATRLPILDGGFDQQQIVFGVTRHIETKHADDRPYEMVGSR
jgi:hypothetical protein